MNNKKKNAIIAGIVSMVIAATVLTGFVIMNNSNKLNVQISSISTDNYPEIAIEVDKVKNKSCFSKENIKLYDNDKIIEEFNVEKSNNGWTLKYDIPERKKEGITRNVRIENQKDSEEIVTGSYEKKEQKDLNLNVTQVDSNNYPEINVYFTAEDLNENLIEGLKKGNIKLLEEENGTQVNKEISDLQFVEKDQSVSINLVMDTSDSMKPMIDKCKGTAINFLNNMNLDTGDKVEFIEFNEHPKINNYFTSNKQSLINSVSSIDVEGMTSLYDSLIMSLNQTNLQDGAKCVIAFTDGLDNRSSSTSNDVINLSKKLGIPIYIIGFGKDIEVNTLKDIANSTDGEFINIYDIGELEKIYNNILKKTKKQYVLKYNINEETGNVVNRNIELSLDSRDYMGSKKGKYQIKPEEYRVNIQKYKELRESLNDKVAERFKSVEGKYALAFKDLNQSDMLSINNEKTVSASVIKIYIMIEAYNQIKNGKIHLNDVVTLRNDMKAEGSGIILNQPEGTKYTVQELIDLMMLKSDNTAANIMIDMIGMNKINDGIKALGCINTELNRKMMDQNAIKNGIENYVSVEDLCLTFTKLYNGQCIDDKYDKYMLDLMKKNEAKSKIPNKLPSGVMVSNKSGEYTGIQNDAGIVYTDKGAYIICVTTKEGNEENQVNAISDISKEIYDAYIQYKK
ncbi:serine hydrolase [Clostridium beijerinckii]|uniref:VWA domain-containing protein n=1 Tax=Clostridium beijerinckii TaxID=1520 RepID=A0A7X9SSB6_CLOBE|nr:serine hydrolase [Clostridium beijerinckii]NMF07118.1 VWA domain-containing protein [Clostridium beijerinckii]